MFAQIWSRTRKAPICAKPEKKIIVLLSVVVGRFHRPPFLLFSFLFSLVCIVCGALTASHKLHAGEREGREDRGRQEGRKELQTFLLPGKKEVRVYRTTKLPFSPLPLFPPSSSFRPSVRSSLPRPPPPAAVAAVAAAASRRHRARRPLFRKQGREEDKSSPFFFSTGGGGGFSFELRFGLTDLKRVHRVCVYTAYT